MTRLWIFVTFAVVGVCADATSFQRAVSDGCSVCKCHNVTADCRNLKLQNIPTLRSNITHVLLSWNNFTHVTSDLFSNIKALNITSIKLDHCNITSLSNNSFRDLHWLSHLNVNGNRKLRLEELLAALEMTNITKLNMDCMNYMDIKWMYPHVSPLRNIRHVTLRSNIIEKFNASFFSHVFPFLQSLDLTNNSLETFPFAENLSHIELVNLSDNRIESNGLKFCGNFSNKLRILDLSWNYLSDISIFLSEGHCLSQLEDLILSNNYHIFKIPDNVFSRLPKISKILLKYVSERVDIGPHAFNASTLHELRLTTSEKLHLRSEHIKMFKQSPNIQTIHFTNVIFKNVSEHLSDMFSHLVNMRDFKIKYGMVDNISFLSTMTNLTILQLQGNYIKRWDSEIFTNLPLKEIILSGNQIAVFNETSFPMHIWNNLRYFSASNNPFQCTCDFLWFRDWLAENHEKLSKHYPKLYECLYPDEWKEKTVDQYEPDKHECNPPVRAQDVIGVGLGCLAAVLLLLAFIVYKGRYHIKHRMLLVRSLQPYDHLPDGEEFVYDAFVAHHIDNRLWVINHLLPFLEKQRKLRLCLHERDFLPGNFIADNITNNMKVSRKVILVFSRDFVKSEWCQFEATTAYQRVIAEGTASVVIVMLEDISHQPNHDTIQSLIHAVTYIEWKNDKSTRPEFFQKLLDALQ
ncbi:toll-like receptor 13 [Ylistrum balloti]|uniref:toll-like receptor 13 n=1 Tax=Ylistrum balloti TaxID=509963 RepID=UPI002905EB5E|nr:toll-like receptor 13 [Ylistrum balloti]